jgi:hypothetical protein
MKAAGALFLSLFSAAAGAALATYALKKRNEIDKYDFEFDEDDFLDDDCDCDDCAEIKIETVTDEITDEDVND